MTRTFDFMSNQFTCSNTVSHGKKISTFEAAVWSERCVAFTVKAYSLHSGHLQLWVALLPHHPGGSKRFRSSRHLHASVYLLPLFVDACTECKRFQEKTWLRNHIFHNTFYMQPALLKAEDLNTSMRFRILRKTNIMVKSFSFRNRRPGHDRHTLWDSL